MNDVTHEPCKGYDRVVVDGCRHCRKHRRQMSLHHLLVLLSINPAGTDTDTQHYQVKR